MITLREYLFTNNLIDELMNYDLGVNPKSIQNHLIINYGSKLINENILLLSASDVANMIYDVYGATWQKLITKDNYSLGATSVRKITEKIDKTEERNNERNDKNLASAFDEDELVIDTGLNSSLSDSLMAGQTKVTTMEDINLLELFNNLSIEQKNNIINTISKDIVNTVTLPIY